MAEQDTATQDEATKKEIIVANVNTFLDSLKGNKATAIAYLYAVETIVNNLPEPLDNLLSKGFECQCEFKNETDYRVATLGDAILAQVKAQARGAVVTWDAAIAKCQKLHKEFNREQAISFLRKTNTGEMLERIATVAEAVKTELS